MTDAEKSILMNNRSTILTGAIFLMACGDASQSGQPPATELRSATETPVAQLVSDTLPAYVFSTDFLMGKFDPATHPDFVKADRQYTDGDTYFLHHLTYEAFKKMHAAAAADGITLTIISATRPFQRQKQIWEAKWTGARLVGGKNLSKSIPNPRQRALKILEYSSMPGTSRHHWGTDVDLNELENEYFTQGRGLKEYEWLVANAGRFGFCQVYSEKGTDRPDGYNLEKWHWSYLPMARKLTEFARHELKNEDISGFLGAETAAQIDVVNKYVLGINPVCR